MGLQAHEYRFATNTALAAGLSTRDTTHSNRPVHQEQPDSPLQVTPGMNCRQLANSLGAPGASLLGTWESTDPSPSTTPMSQKSRQVAQVTGMYGSSRHKKWVPQVSILRPGRAQPLPVH